MKQWYEELFQNYADKYDNEAFTKGTIGEVNFIEEEINYNKNAKILDVGCGTGRHSIELAKRGYQITGIDLSESMLNKAKKRANDLGLTIEFILKDAREFNFKESFDLVIMICEGAFPLMESDEMNFIILQNIYLSLKEKGKLILTTLNALFPLFNLVNQSSAEDLVEHNTFDLMTFRKNFVYNTTDDIGNNKILQCNERYYVPSEIRWLLKSIGFKQSDIFGCKLGSFSRDDKLTSEDFEMLVVAKK